MSPPNYPPRPEVGGVWTPPNIKLPPTQLQNYHAPTCAPTIHLTVDRIVHSPTTKLIGAGAAVAPSFNSARVGGTRFESFTNRNSFGIIYPNVMHIRRYYTTLALPWVSVNIKYLLTYLLSYTPIFSTGSHNYLPTFIKNYTLSV